MIVASALAFAMNAVATKYTPLILMSIAFVHSSTVSVPKGRTPIKYPALLTSTPNSLPPNSVLISSNA